MGIVEKWRGLIDWAGGPALPDDTDAIIEEVMRRPLPNVVQGHTGYAASDGLPIWYESIAPSDPVRGSVLLHMGLAADALVWPPSFVDALLREGYRIVRYDHRGTGMSDWVENWDRRQPYSVDDMTGDAIAVLDAAGIPRAHQIGLSLGGMVAQEVAIQQPKRVASMVLMMTSGHVSDPDLPGLTTDYLVKSFFKGLPLLKYRIRGGEKNLVKERIARRVAASGYGGFDIKEIAEVVLYDLRERRGTNLKAGLQHQAAVTITGSRYDALQTLNTPTMVIHGTDDPFIPIEHGHKLAELIPGAEGLWLDGVGHVFPMPDMDRVMGSILAHLERAAMEPDQAAAT